MSNLLKERMGAISKKIVPYFQPIFAVDTGEIYGYEVLGRYEDKSLGSVFAKASTEDALKIDRVIRKQALEQYVREGIDRFLFLNLRLEWIAQFADKLEEIPTLMWAKDLGVDLSKLVIEITEEEFNTDSEILDRVIAHYRRFGCRIAVDDYGKHASNIDRLAALSPDIIKIDMDYIHKSEDSFHYCEFLQMLTLFAKRVGIEVLYEGIETQKQLDICIDSNGRYYQGFLLGKPQPFMLNPVVNNDVFTSSSFRSIMALHERADHMNKQRRFWDLRIEQYITEKKFNLFLNDINDYFSEMFNSVSDQAKRIYLTNRRGEQLTYNIELDADNNIRWSDYRRRNWAWRSFFQEAMIMLDAGMKSYLSAAYRDVSTKEEIYTYAYAINTDLYLFIDILPLTL